MAMRILVADDHVAVRQSLIRGLQYEADVEIVAEAGDGCSAVAMTKEFMPDIVLMDIAMPHLNGIEATRQIAAECPGVRVVGLSVHDSSQYADAMFRAGASGYVVKDGDIQELVKALGVVVQGQTYRSDHLGGPRPQ
jgi:DNA-binding NarL/FixJ family response regulator